MFNSSLIQIIPTSSSRRKLLQNASARSIENVLMSWTRKGAMKVAHLVDLLTTHFNICVLAGRKVEAVRAEVAATESNWVPSGDPSLDLVAHRVAAKQIILKEMQHQVLYSKRCPAT